MSFNSSLLADLTALFNDNTAGDISAADGRTVIEALLELAHPLDHKPGSADTPDDDFNTGALDGKWTVVTGTEAAVSLLQTATVSRYDVDTRLGWLLCQVGGDGSEGVNFRQDYTLPDNASIITKMAMAVPWDGEPGFGGNEMIIQLGVNDNDAGSESGNHVVAGLQVHSNGLRVRGFHNGANIVASSGFGGIAGYVGLELGILLRIARSGTDFFTMASLNGGQAWCPLGAARAPGTTMTNVWLSVANAASHSAVVPVIGFDWVRQGTNNLDPW